MAVSNLRFSRLDPTPFRGTPRIPWRKFPCLIRPESPETVNHLKKMGLQVMMLTGDARTVAEWVGRELDLAYTHQGWSLYERPDFPLQQGTE